MSNKKKTSRFIYSYDLKWLFGGSICACYDLSWSKGNRMCDRRTYYMFYAGKMNDLKLCKQAIQSGADVNFPFSGRKGAKGNQTGRVEYSYSYHSHFNCRCYKVHDLINLTYVILIMAADWFMVLYKSRMPTYLVMMLGLRLSISFVDAYFLLIASVCAVQDVTCHSYLLFFIFFYALTVSKYSADYL